MQSLGETVFISYRGDHYDIAQRLARWLLDGGACTDVVLVPPFSLTADSEILLPYEFFELMEPIIDRIARADAFVALVYDYDDSYFTQAELFQWRRFAKKPTVWAAEAGGGGFVLTPFPQEPATKDQKVLWAKISTQIHPQMKGRTASIWGRYARHCYLVPCRHCGEHFLATRGVVEPAAETSGAISCRHCSAAVHLGQLPRRGNYYRKPIVLTDPRNAKMRPLEQGELLTLLVGDDEPPPRIPLLTLPGETIRSETKTLLMTVLGGVGLVAGALLLAALASDDDESQ